MKLAIEADYALRIMQTLATSETRCDTPTLSKRCGMTRQTSLKILRMLLSAGLVVSFQGTGGGYELSRTPDSITLYEILSAVDENITFSRCLDDEYDCSRMHKSKNACYFHRLFDEINTMIESKLSGIVLSQTVNNNVEKQ